MPAPISGRVLRHEDGEMEDTQRIKEILARIKDVKVGVYGDFCIDAYWIMDPRGSEVSVETGLQGQAVREHYYSLGGASNIAANLAALEPASMQAIGAIGDDIFGRELTRQLHELDVDTKHLVLQKTDLDTVAFGKQYFEDEARPRIDFGFFNKRSVATDRALLKGIREVLRTVDVLIFNQQVPNSIPNDAFIEEVNAICEEFADRIVLLDSRHYGERFKGVFRKTNDLEAARLNGIDVHPGDVLRSVDIEKYARKLYEESRKPVFVTRGHRGILVVDSGGCQHVPGIQLIGRLDTVGAGDTTVSAIALCLAAGITPSGAAEFANFAAAVTVQKLFRTGTASGAEILEVGADPAYIYQPELASDPRQARYPHGAEMELCCEAVPCGRIKHAVFDHDGTISTLRQGWEEIMAPVMMEAILGDKYQTADETLYHKARNRVLDYIDKSTGIQTILQMEALVEMVKEFGIVKTDKVLDKIGYKRIYNKALMALVRRRIEKFKRGELDINDYTLKGAVPFLKALKHKGLTLYLASGTDCKDVKAEATALGYAHIFGDKIYGAVGDVAKYSKKMVIDRIMTENQLEGPELAVFGDGPVEMRECRKRDGVAVGIASDEIRRHGLNIEKRTRLIEAGAQIILPDFSQWDRIVKYLFEPGLTPRSR